MKEIFGVKYYNIKETAEMLGVTRQSVVRYRLDGKITPTYIGKLPFYTEADIKSLVASPK